MAPSDISSLKVNNSSFDLLNAAIASNHQTDNNDSNLTEDDFLETQETQAHGKRIHDTEDLNATAPKRAGRKPLDESKTMESMNKDPKQKRKAQNRAAQRAFRERKEKHVSELQARIDELERLNETKDEALVKENEELKEMLRQLREENYSLKGAQFTFEFPLSENNNHLHPISPFTTSSSSASPTEQHNPYSNMSHMSSSNSYTGEDISSSSEQSPLSNEDDLPSVGTPAVPFSTDLLQFGLIPSAHDVNTTSATTTTTTNNSNNTTSDVSSLNLFAPTNSINNNNNNNNNNSNGNNNSTAIDHLPAGDLFHGKDNLFSNYREPISIGDDFLFANEDLSNLFASDGDFFGLNYDSNNNTNLFPPSASGVNDLFSLNAQFGLPEPPMSRVKHLSFERKLEMYERVKKAKEEGKRVYELHQELKQEIPEFDLDSLCDELRNKAQCSLSPFKVTANEVDAFVKCLDRV